MPGSPYNVVDLPVGTRPGTVVDAGIVQIARVLMRPASPGNPYCKIQVLMTLANGQRIELFGVANEGRGELMPANVPYQNGAVEAGRFALIGQHAVLLELHGLTGSVLGLFIQKTVYTGLVQALGTGWMVTDGNALAAFDLNISTYQYDDFTLANSFRGAGGDAIGFLAQFANNPGTIPDAAKPACVNCNQVSVPTPIVGVPGVPVPGPGIAAPGINPYIDNSIRGPGFYGRRF
jgi:hypothetical protein